MSQGVEIRGLLISVPLASGGTGIAPGVAPGTVHGFHCAQVVTREKPFRELDVGCWGLGEGRGVLVGNAQKGEGSENFSRNSILWPRGSTESAN